MLRLIGLPHSVTDASLVFDDKGKVAGRAVETDGWPDVTASLPPSGRLLGFETKSKDGRLRPAQIACHAWLRSSGALVIVPRRVEEVAAALVDAGIRHQVLTQLLQNPLPHAAAKECRTKRVLK
ncbi:MAG: VRR-NUC domain-containing protein [Acidobacteria bacterium]|nr:VRR-NUC domain-containing protein [Acidobacteriota bacterium]